MKQLNKNETERIKEGLLKYKSQLLKYKGVVKVGYGLAMKNDQITEVPALVVFVRHKRSKESISKKQILPTEIDGIRIDVLEYDPKFEEDPYSRIDPLTGGINISRLGAGGSGTLGGIFYDTTSNEAIGVTNWHVAKGRRGRGGDTIVQPGGYGIKEAIGYLYDWSRTLDVAIIKLNKRTVQNRSKINLLNGDIAGIINAIPGMPLVKSGARTKITYGMVQTITDNEIVIVPNPNKTPPGTDISDHGDSGSIWLADDGSMNAVALHWGGATKGYYAYAKDLVIISQTFKFKV